MLGISKESRLVDRASTVKDENSSQGYCERRRALLDTGQADMSIQPIILMVSMAED